MYLASFLQTCHKVRRLATTAVLPATLTARSLATAGVLAINSFSCPHLGLIWQSLWLGQEIVLIMQANLDSWPFHDCCVKNPNDVITWELPGVALVNISTGQIFIFMATLRNTLIFWHSSSKKIILLFQQPSDGTEFWIVLSSCVLSGP